MSNRWRVAGSLALLLIVIALNVLLAWALATGRVGI